MVLMKLQIMSFERQRFKKMERQAIDLEKILAISLSGKRLVSRIYNKLLQLTNRKINNPQATKNISGKKIGRRKDVSIVSNITE